MGLGRQAMRRPSENSTTWFSRVWPFVFVMRNTAPAPVTRGDDDSCRFSLPSHSG